MGADADSRSEIPRWVSVSPSARVFLYVRNVARKREERGQGNDSGAVSVALLGGQEAGYIQEDVPKAV
jgi:hypothetical protein